MSKLPRIYICIDNGKVWEAFGDIEASLIIKDVDRVTIERKIIKDIGKVEEEDLVLTLLEEEKITKK